MIEKAIREVSCSETIFQRNHHLLINYLTKDFFQAIKISKSKKSGNYVLSSRPKPSPLLYYFEPIKQISGNTNILPSHGALHLVLFLN